MSQNKFSQQSINLPEISLPENFFSNFEEITNKYADIDKKKSDTKYYDNGNDINDIINYKNDINKIKFHPLNKTEYAELIFDSPRAKKIYKSNGKTDEDLFLKEEEDEDGNIFRYFLKSDIYNKNKNKKNNYDINYWDIEKSNNCIIPNFKELLKFQPWDEDVEFINEHLLNNKPFKPMQKEIINSVLMDKDIFVFMPKKSQKYICYQIPSIISNDMITLVVLSSNELINGQVKLMNELGIKVLNLETFDDENCINIEQNLQNENLEERVKLMYVTPEKLFKNKNILNLAMKLYDDKKLKRIIIDEINLMSKWDRNFREDYFELKKIKEYLKNVKILGFSSTPYVKIRDDVINLLNMKKVLYFKISYNKPNIYFEVKNKKDIIYNPIDDFGRIIKNYYENKSGIIYCNSKKECDEISDILNKKYNINCLCYNEELSDEEKNQIVDKWTKEEIGIIVTNKNLILGVNKINVRFIINYNIPKSFDIYYKQIESAGIDGEASRCILYYSASEFENIYNSIINNKNIDIIQKVEELRELRKFKSYCEEENECRRVLLLSYFNENTKKDNCFHMCNNCMKSLNYEYIDCSKEAKIILGLLIKLKKENCTLNLINDILKGNNKQYSDEISKNTIEYFGKLSDYKSEEINKLIFQLIIKGHINEYIINERTSIYNITDFGQRFYNDENMADGIILIKVVNNNGNSDNSEKVISINNNTLKEEKYVYHRNYQNNIYYNNKTSLKNQYKIENTKDYGLCEPTEFDDLFEQLKNIRREILKKENEKRRNKAINGNFIPLNLQDIFTDTGLKELVRKLPTKIEDFSKELILAEDKNNINLYGNEFLPTIIKFINIYNIDINKRKEIRKNYLYDNDKIYNFDVYKEEEKKMSNDKKYVFIGLKRYGEKSQQFNNNIGNNAFDRLANKNKTKKNKKAKFL